MKRIPGTILFAALLSCASVAAGSDFELGAYVRLPLDKGGTVFGLSVRPKVEDAFAREFSPNSDVHNTGLHLQGGLGQVPVMMLNGVPLNPPQVLNQNADSETGNGRGVDWYLVAGVALGVGLIVAIANSDNTSVAICSGPNCPPPKPEPPKPEEE